MGERTSIEWCDATFNVAWGCEKIGPGCKHCYAETWAKRMGHAVWGAHAPRRTFGAKHWNDPIVWARKWAAEKHGRRMRIFTSSMCDVFEDHPTIEAELPKLWALIRATPDVDWLVLTKRVERMRELLPSDLPNVWAGASVSTQADADELVPQLLRVRAPLRFISFEPALEAIDFDQPRCQYHDRDEVSVDTVNGGECCAACCDDGSPGELSHGWWLDALNDGIAWVIVGGESGPGARPLFVDVVRSTVAQCRAAGVACLVKQLGARPLVDFYTEEARELIERIYEDLVVVDRQGRPHDARDGQPRPGDAFVQLPLRDRKGGDWSEWPVWARVRDFPRDEATS